jgi:hypothetical protein
MVSFYNVHCEMIGLGTAIPDLVADRKVFFRIHYMVKCSKIRLSTHMGTIFLDDQ